MKRLALFIPVFLILIGTYACKQVDLQAPSGADLSLAVDPPTIGDRGVATLTVVGVRANGAPLPDGTMVQFLIGEAPPPPPSTPTNSKAGSINTIGTITPNPVEIQNGVATAVFRGLGRSGVVEIHAISGLAGPSNTVTISVGAAAVAEVTLTATPSTLPPEGGTSQIRAFVRDTQGNPVPGVRVFFSADDGTLASNGVPVITDSSGVARDTLIVDEDDAPGGSVTVTAITESGDEDSATIQIDDDPIFDPPSCSFVFSPSDPEEDEDVFFVDTSTDEDGVVTRSEWNFGDGDQDSGFETTHSYDAPGSYTVVHTVEDDDGETANCEQTITVVEENADNDPPNCSFTTSPESPDTNDNVIFNASTTTDSDGEVVRYRWNFGDSAQIVTRTDPVTQHKYNSPGTYNVSLVAEDNDGATCTAFGSVTVN